MCACARVRVCACARVRVCACARVRVCACARVRVCPCARVRVCACARVRVCVVLDYLPFRCIPRVKVCTCLFPRQWRSWSKLHISVRFRNLPCLFEGHIVVRMLCHGDNRFLKICIVTLNSRNMYNINNIRTQKLKRISPIICYCNVLISFEIGIHMYTRCNVSI